MRLADEGDDAAACAGNEAHVANVPGGLTVMARILRCVDRVQRVDACRIVSIKCHKIASKIL